MTDRELIAQAKRWADYLRPVVENDNAWYGTRWLDGHDAGEIGELLEAIAAVGDRLLPDLRGVTSIHAGWIPTMDDERVQWEGWVDTPEVLGAGRAVADSPAAAIRDAYEGTRT